MPKGGPRPNSGGARPGAGRKSDETRQYQEAMRRAFEEAVTPEAWRAIIATAIEQAKQGDDRARAWLSPWIVGKVPDEVRHSGSVGVTHRPDLSTLSDQELDALDHILGKTATTRDGSGGSDSGT